MRTREQIFSDFNEIKEIIDYVQSLVDALELESRHCDSSVVDLCDKMYSLLNDYFFCLEDLENVLADNLKD